jgi:hypothetical protein
MPKFFSLNRSKTVVETAWLCYFVIWSLVLLVVMVGGFATEWGDVPLMLLGVLLCAGTYASPFVFYAACWLCPHPPESVRTSSLREVADATAAMSAGVTALSFGLNWLMTPFFFDVLHMRYGFHVTIRIERNPVFLYFLTVPYFSFYATLGCMGYRVFSSRVPPCMRAVAAIPIAFGLAFLETLLMANPLIKTVFCYDDLFLVLTFGSVCYGVGFVFAIFSWIRAVPEDPRQMLVYPFSGRGAFASPRMWLHAVSGNTAAAILTSIVLHYVRLYIAPLLTTVINNSPPVGGCLLQ